jgi:hypothetical protein
VDRTAASSVAVESASNSFVVGRGRNEQFVFMRNTLPCDCYRIITGASFLCHTTADPRAPEALSGNGVKPGFAFARL